MMSGIKGKNTRPELSLRSILFARGLRYRLHSRKLPGTPDLVFPKYKAIVFIHGCFWHRHVGCRYTTTPKTNKEFWRQKFLGNVERDRRDIESLLNQGWRTAIVWECAIKTSAQEAAANVDAWLHGNDRELVIG